VSETLNFTFIIISHKESQSASAPVKAKHAPDCLICVTKRFVRPKHVFKPCAVGVTAEKENHTYCFLL
jgi:hypothetical protein